MWITLLLLFVVLPFVDLVLLLRIGSWLGFWPTVALSIAMGILGGWLAKREGLRVLRAWRRALEELRAPDQGIIDGVLVIAGGALLIAPGVLTDIIGFLFLIPWTRLLVAKLVRRWVDRRIAEGRLHVVSASVSSYGSTFGEGAPGSGSGRAAPDRVVDTSGESVGEVPELPGRRG